MESAKKILITLAVLVIIVPLLGFPPMVETWILVLLGGGIIFFLVRKPRERAEKEVVEKPYMENGVSVEAKEKEEVGATEENEKAEN